MGGVPGDVEVGELDVEGGEDEGACCRARLIRAGKQRQGDSRRASTRSPLSSSTTLTRHLQHHHNGTYVVLCTQHIVSENTQCSYHYRSSMPRRTDPWYVVCRSDPSSGIADGRCPPPQLVELKNGETFNGHLVNCDNFMNITLREVYQTNAEGDRFWKLKECYIRGSTVRVSMSSRLQRNHDKLCTDRSSTYGCQTRFSTL